MCATYMIVQSTEDNSIEKSYIFANDFDDAIERAKELIKKKLS